MTAEEWCVESLVCPFSQPSMAAEELPLKALIETGIVQPAADLWRRRCLAGVAAISREMHALPPACLFGARWAGCAGLLALPPTCLFGAQWTRMSLTCLERCEGPGRRVRHMHAPAERAQKLCMRRLGALKSCACASWTCSKAVRAAPGRAQKLCMRQLHALKGCACI
eukprot:366265-Chlamydomonas_euryale.AAC.9